ncbi:MAG: DNA polymerase [candidate division WWE3 bacterium]|nr:DNA polymerase [candidate division WWE3 bacterium]
MLDLKNPNYEYVISQDRLLEIVNDELPKHEMIAVDTEATGLDPYLAKLLLVQIGTPEKAYIFDARKLDMAPIKSILEDCKILKILQNGKFDYSLLKVKLNVAMVNVFDTMLAEQLVNAGLGRRNASLKDIAKKYLDLDIDKDYANYNWENLGSVHVEFSERHLTYAANDVFMLFPIFQAQFADIQKKDLVKTAQLEFAVMPVVAEMEVKGSHIDVAKWRANLEELKIKRNTLAKQIQNEIRPLYNTEQVDLFGNVSDVININSQQQLLDLFNNKLGLNMIATGEEHLSKSSHPIAKLMLEYRGVEKLISAFGENLLAKIHPRTGRLHPDFMQLGADTGRFSCSSPNLQQIPKESSFRSCFTAAPGYKLVTADYSQMELRILAEASKDPVMLKAYDDKLDLHTYTASKMFNIPFDEVTKPQRFNAKSINFGLMYGRGAASLAAQIGCSVDEGKLLLRQYFDSYKGVKIWLDHVAKEAVNKGYSVTLGGRKRWYNMPESTDPMYEKLISNIERQGKNTPIQGSSADITKYALVFIHKKIKELGLAANIIHTVHDEIVVEIREDQAEAWLPVQIAEMERAGQLLLKRVPVEADGAVSDIWEH